MLDCFTATLEACDPKPGRFRSYRIDAGTDLFGDWLVDVTYGRIGSRGRSVRHVAADEAEARRIVRHCLQRRATAKRRIGVPHRPCELIDPAGWMPVLHHPTLTQSTLTQSSVANDARHTVRDDGRCGVPIVLRGAGTPTP